MTGSTRRSQYGNRRRVVKVATTFASVVLIAAGIAVLAWHPASSTGNPDGPTQSVPTDSGRTPTTGPNSSR